MDYFKIIKNRFELECLLGKTSFSLEDIQRLLTETETIIKNKPDKIRYRIIEIVSKINRTEKMKDNKIYYLVDNINYMMYDLNTNIFYISYKEFWSILETEFKLSNDEIAEFLKNMLTEHYDCIVESVIKMDIQLKLILS